MTDRLSTLPLSKLHLAAGADMIVRGEWEIPAHYQHFDVEFEDLEKRAGLVDLSWMTVVRVEGADRGDYLNRRLSQKVDDLVPGESRRATLLDATGKMISDLEVHALADKFLLLAPPIPHFELACELEKYVFSEDVRFVEITDDTALLAVLGPLTEEVLDHLDVDSIRAERAAVAIPLNDIPGLTHLRSGYVPWGAMFFATKSDAHALAGRLVEGVERVGGHLVGWRALDAFRIARGIAWWGIDLDSDTIPLEADLLDAIHFDKGCYPGQETIAKISNLGHPSRKFVRVRLDDSPSALPGVTLLTDEGKKAGKLTSFARVPGGEVLGIAAVKWAHREGGTFLVDGTDVRAIVTGPCHASASATQI